MGYSTRFLAPVTIYTPRDPRYTVIWKSTKLVNFVISTIFMGYSIRLLAPVTIYTACDPPVQGNLEVDKTREFCHFWPFSWAVSHGFGIHTVFGRGDDFNGP